MSLITLVRCAGYQVQFFWDDGNPSWPYDSKKHQKEKGKECLVETYRDNAGQRIKSHADPGTIISILPDLKDKCMFHEFLKSNKIVVIVRYRQQTINLKMYWSIHKQNRLQDMQTWFCSTHARSTHQTWPLSNFDIEFSVDLGIN